MSPVGAGSKPARDKVGFQIRPKKGRVWKPPLQSLQPQPQPQPKQSLRFASTNQIG